MRFLADECIDAALVAALRAAGHDVRAIQESAAGIPDAGVLEIAANEARVLITEDKDFGDFAFRKRTVAIPGIVLLRIPTSARSLKWLRLDTAIRKFGDRLIGHYVVVGENRLRARPLSRGTRTNDWEDHDPSRSR